MTWGKYETIEAIKKAIEDLEMLLRERDEEIAVLEAELEEAREEIAVLQTRV